MELSQAPHDQHPVLSQTTAANHIALIVKQSRIKHVMAGVTKPLYPNMVLHLITPNFCNYTVQVHIDAADPMPHTFLKPSLH